MHTHTSIRPYVHTHVHAYLAGQVALGEALKSNRHLEELAILGHPIRSADFSIAPLAEALETNSTLRVLNLSGQPLGTDGLCAVAAALHLNRGLRHLGLNEIRDRYPEPEPDPDPDPDPDRLALGRTPHGD